ncbi:hypothetical protein [Aureivirga marina]|uniref:hypothetical protein n=1 Tax=Aureivirga marina TaxID=1182451 RepID=UPI0018CB359E|nr:hypothetical protein [Aureivirga marina]
MKKIFLILIIVFISKPVFSQSNYTNMLDNFFSTYKTDREKALNDIFNTNEWLTNNKKGLISIQSRINHEILQMGNYNGYEELITTTLSDFLVLKSYVLKYDRQPILFTFIFYKAKDQWILYDFNYDNDINDELYDKARNQYLNKSKSK